jgi:hypothetical protein
MGMLADIGLVLFANSPVDVAPTIQHVDLRARTFSSAGKSRARSLGT